MGVTAGPWLIDNSALARLDIPEVASIVVPRIRDGLVGVSIVTELEIGFSARSTAHYRATRESIVDHLLPIALPFRAESRAREVQAMLVSQGRHRSAGVADLLIAATAEIEGFTVLHYDADFDLVTAVTGQPTEWVLPRGSIT